MCLGDALGSVPGQVELVRHGLGGGDEGVAIVDLDAGASVNGHGSVEGWWRAEGYLGGRIQERGDKTTDVTAVARGGRAPEPLTDLDRLDHLVQVILDLSARSERVGA